MICYVIICYVIILDLLCIAVRDNFPETGGIKGGYEYNLFYLQFYEKYKGSVYGFDYFSEYAHCSRVVGYHDFVQRLLLQHCRQTFLSSSHSPTEKESIPTLFIARSGCDFGQKLLDIGG